MFPDELRDSGDGWTLALATSQCRQRLRNGGGGIADGESYAPRAEVDAENPGHLNEGIDGLIDGLARAQTTIERFQRYRRAKKKTTTRITAGTAFHFQHRDFCVGSEPQKVGQQARCKKTARASSRFGVHLHPIRGIECTHTRMEGGVRESAPAARGEELAQAAPERICGQCAQRCGTAISCTKRLCKSREQRITGSVASSTQRTGRSITTNLRAQGIAHGGQ